MDWSLPDLKSITVQIKVIDGSGKYLFDAITWAGFVGIFTAINKRMGYTISLNYRRNETPNLLENLKMLLTGAYPHGYFIRELLSSDKEPYEQIRSISLVSPAYYIIMCPEFSGVIVRDRKQVLKVKFAPCVQTNCDESGVGDNILYSFERLEYMKTTFDSMSKLVKHISKFPVKTMRPYIPSR